VRARTALVSVTAGVCAVVLGLAGVAQAAPAQAAKKVGPDQSFRALVNGHPGTAAPVPIRVACLGPVTPGETGHPMPGQSVEVLLGASSAAQAGFTGPNGTSIGVFFGAPPPSAAPGAGLLTLRRYGVAKPIPLSLVLPCSGTGHVFFVPLPMSPPTSRSVAVSVTYVG
jgi:hypothetical protein